METTPVVHDYCLRDTPIPYNPASRLTSPNLVDRIDKHNRDYDAVCSGKK